MNIDRYVGNNNMTCAIEECIKNNFLHLAWKLDKFRQYHNTIQAGIERLSLENCVVEEPYSLLAGSEEAILERIFQVEKKIRVKLLCNWCSSQELANLWNKMSKGNYTWNNIQIVWEGDVDYHVIINATSEQEVYDKKKTIVFRMEPNMKNHQGWGVWRDPNPADFFAVLKHEDGFYNNNEWHLSKTYSELLCFSPEKKYGNIISTVLSGKYNDTGHVKRVEFARFLDTKCELHVYGQNRWDYKNYKGVLPSHQKDEGIFPYKYTFNVENFSIQNYYTEKLIDGILGECLVFYSGCYNAKEYIDERAFVYLELSNFEKDFQLMQKAIAEDWHTQRLPYIRAEKMRILNELQFFPRLEKMLS